MVNNMKNWRILSAIFLSAALTLFWNNCSEVGFQTAPGALNQKVGGFEVIPGTPPGSNTSSEDGSGSGSGEDGSGSGEGEDGSGSGSGEDGSGSGEGEDGSGSGEGEDGSGSGEGEDHDTGHLNACGIETADIIVNVAFIAGAPGKQSPLVSKTGEVSLLELVESGLEVKALASIKQTNQVRMMFADAGHYILDKNGNKHALIISSQDNSGYHLKLDGQVAIDAGSSYLLKVNALPELKEQEKGCRLHPNWEDVSLSKLAQ